jgi:serine/threonine protein kinase
MACRAIAVPAEPDARSRNHPHIAGDLRLEESGGVRAVVTKLVEGEDLSQRIARGAIPLDEALRITKQIAEALDAAHECLRAPL